MSGQPRAESKRWSVFSIQWLARTFSRIAQIVTDGGIEGGTETQPKSSSVHEVGACRHPRRARRNTKGIPIIFAHNAGYTGWWHYEFC